MAIKRTTNQEVPSGGHPPKDGEPGKEKKGSSTKSVVAKRKGSRAATPRQAVPGTQARSGGPSTNFFADTMIELKRVVWPHKDRVMAGSTITILLLFFFGIYIGVLDFVAKGIFHALGLYGG